MEDRLITVAIHTYEKALVLKSLLESEGVRVTLQNVNLVQPVVSSGVRVRIHEADLPLALRVIETSDMLCPDAGRDPDRSRQPVLLVPVDESDHSIKAVRVAFRLATMHNARVLLLHAFISPVIGVTNPLNDTLTFASEVAESEQFEDMEELARNLMDTIAKKVRGMIADGTIPPVKFSTRLEEGVPEDVINTVAREIQPVCLVMGTREAGRKEREMIGSVTAEVLDTCRFTVFTVPETAVAPPPGVVLSALYFGNMDQADVLALDTLYRIFSDLRLDVTLVSIPSKKSPAQAQTDALLTYCMRHYPRFTFKKATVDMPTIASEMAELLKDYRVDLLVMPNKKRNVFARFFNPTLPHRLLYDAGLPMLVIPV